MRSKVRWAGHMPHGKDGCRQNSKESGRERWKKHQGCKKRESEQLRSKDCVRWDMRRSKDGEGAADRRYGKKQQKE